MHLKIAFKINIETKKVNKHLTHFLFTLVARNHTNNPYEINWNLLIIKPDAQDKIFLRMIKFDGHAHTTSFEELKEKSILTSFMENDESYRELLNNFIIIKFAYNTNNVYNILKNGIKLSDSRQIYRYLGHSNSKLREDDGKTCILMPADSNTKVYDFIESFSPELNKITKVEKQAKRIAQLFSRFNRYVKLSTSEYRLINDVQNENYIFTDGCGFMSTAFAEQVKFRMKLDYIPSVCQIRYRGFKGVLMHVPEVEKVKIHFRESMKKFETEISNLDIFGIVDFSKSFKPAYLNTQTIMLLESVGVSERILRIKQKDFYEMLNSLSSNIHAAIQYLSCFGHSDLLESVQKNRGIEKSIETQLSAFRKKEIDKMYENRRGNKIKYKTRILVQQSRLVFGVCDPYGILNENECYFNPTLLKDDKEKFENSDTILVTRNPCYAPGDIRKLKLANRKRNVYYSHLYDCIVFSVKGERSIADQMSGGDLDGDQFMVIWDVDLIPREIVNPVSYNLGDSKNYQEFEPKYSLGNIIQSSAAHTKKNISIESNTKNSSKVEARSLSPMPTSIKSRNMDSKVKIINYPVNFSCCDETFSSSMKNIENIIQSHLNNYHPTEEFIFKCSKCPYENPKYRGLCGHYGSHQKNESGKASLPSSLSSNENFDSASVSKTIDYPIEFTCCDIIFNDKTKSKEKTILEHFEQKHGTTVNFRCTSCKQEFDSLKGVSIHFPKCKGFDQKKTTENTNKKDISKNKEEIFHRNENIDAGSNLEKANSKSNMKLNLDTPKTRTKQNSSVDINNYSTLSSNENLLKNFNSASVSKTIDYPIEFTCCDIIFNDKTKSKEKTILEHFEQKHGTTVNFRCTSCKQEFDSLKGVSIHFPKCKGFDQKKTTENTNRKDNTNENIEDLDKHNNKLSSNLDADACQILIENHQSVTIYFPINFKCICGEVYHKGKNLEKRIIDHFNEMHEKINYTYCCKRCLMEFATCTSASSHYGTCKKELEIKLNTRSEILNETEKSVQSDGLLFITFPTNFNCSCGETFPTNKSNSEKVLLEHFQNEKRHKNSNYCFQCNKCSKIFNTHEKVSEHFNRCKNDLKMPAAKLNAPSCDLQKEIVKNVSIYSIFYPINFTCDCGTIFGSGRKRKKEAILQHYRDDHPTLTYNFKCSKCDHEFLNYDDVEQHYQLIHSIQEKTPVIKDETNSKDSYNNKNSNAMKISNERKNEIRDNLIKYFSEYDSCMVGNLDSLFMKFAAIKGPECDECVKLNKYLSTALDMPLENLTDIAELRKRAQIVEEENNRPYLQKYKAWIEIKDVTEKFVNKNC